MPGASTLETKGEHMFRQHTVMILGRPRSHAFAASPLYDVSCCDAGTRMLKCKREFERSSDVQSSKRGSLGMMLMELVR